MSIKLSKESYITLIENDIAMVETHLPDCMEQNHIEAVLRDSVNHYYPKCNKKEHPALEENSAPINNSRIIKFRGKRLFNGEWAEGSYIQPDGIIVLDEGGEVEVDPDTVGQFTGLPDRHLKEVCEGDIIKYLDVDNNNLITTRNSEVTYYMGCFVYKLSDGKNQLLGTTSTHDFEVAGNKFDNNELLKGGKE